MWPKFTWPALPLLDSLLRRGGGGGGGACDPLVVEPEGACRTDVCLDGGEDVERLGASESAAAAMSCRDDFCDGESDADSDSLGGGGGLSRRRDGGGGGRPSVPGLVRPGDAGIAPPGGSEMRRCC